MKGQMHELEVILKENDTLRYHLCGQRINDKIDQIFDCISLKIHPEYHFPVWMIIMSILTIISYCSKSVFLTIILLTLMLLIPTLLLLQCNYIVLIQSLSSVNIYYKTINIAIHFYAMSIDIRWGEQFFPNATDTELKTYCFLTLFTNVLVITVISLIDGYNITKKSQIIAILIPTLYYLMKFCAIYFNFWYHSHATTTHFLAQEVHWRTTAIVTLVNTLVFLLRQLYFSIRNPNKLIAAPCYAQFVDNRGENYSFRYSFITSTKNNTKTSVSKNSNIFINDHNHDNDDELSDIDDIDSLSVPSVENYTPNINILTTNGRKKTDININTDHDRKKASSSNFRQNILDQLDSVLEQEPQSVPLQNTDLDLDIDMEMDAYSIINDDDIIMVNNSLTVLSLNRHRLTSYFNIKKILQLKFKLVINSFDTILSKIFELLYICGGLGETAAGKEKINSFYRKYSNFCKIKSILCVMIILVSFGVFFITTYTIDGSTRIIMDILICYSQLWLFLQLNYPIIKHLASQFLFWWKLQDMFVRSLAIFLIEYHNHASVWSLEETNWTQACVIQTFKDVNNMLIIGEIFLVKGFLVSPIVVSLVIIAFAALVSKTSVLFFLSDDDYVVTVYGNKISFRILLASKSVDITVWLAVQLFNQIRYRNGIMILNDVRKIWQ